MVRPRMKMGLFRFMARADAGKLKEGEIVKAGFPFPARVARVKRIVYRDARGNVVSGKTFNRNRGKFQPYPEIEFEAIK